MAVKLTSPLNPPIHRQFRRNRPVKSSVSRLSRRWIRRNIVEVRGTVASDRAIGHGLARGDGGFIFEVEKVIRFLGNVEVLEVPY